VPADCHRGDAPISARPTDEPPLRHPDRMLLAHPPRSLDSPRARRVWEQIARHIGERPIPGRQSNPPQGSSSFRSMQYAMRGLAEAGSAEAEVLSSYIVRSIEIGRLCLPGKSGRIAIIMRAACPDRRARHMEGLAGPPRRGGPGASRRVRNSPDIFSPRRPD